MRKPRPQQESPSDSISVARSIPESQQLLNQMRTASLTVEFQVAALLGQQGVAGKQRERDFEGAFDWLARGRDEQERAPTPAFRRGGKRVIGLDY